MKRLLEAKCKKWVKPALFHSINILIFVRNKKHMKIFIIIVFSLFTSMVYSQSNNRKINFDSVNDEYSPEHGDKTNISHTPNHKGAKGYISQKPDSIVYCQVCVLENGGLHSYRYTIWQANYDGTWISIEAKDCDNPLAPFGKLGADGWHIVTSYKGKEFNEVYFMLEKTYKRK
jgi:hypothetical protein